MWPRCCCKGSRCVIETLTEEMAAGDGSICTSATNILGNAVIATFTWTEPFPDADEYILTAGGATVVLTRVGGQYTMSLTYDGKTLYYIDHVNNQEGVISTDCATAFDHPEVVRIILCDYTVRAEIPNVGIFVDEIEIDIDGLNTNVTPTCFEYTSADIDFTITIRYEYNQLVDSLDCLKEPCDRACPLCEEGNFPHKLRVTIDEVWFGDQYGNHICTGSDGICDCDFIGIEWEMVRQGIRWEGAGTGTGTPPNCGTNCNTILDPSPCSAGVIIDMFCPDADEEDNGPPPAIDPSTLYDISAGLSLSGSVGTLFGCFGSPIQRAQITSPGAGPHDCHGPFVVTFPRPSELDGGPADCSDPFDFSQMSRYIQAVKQITIEVLC